VAGSLAGPIGSIVGTLLGGIAGGITGRQVSIRLFARIEKKMGKAGVAKNIALDLRDYKTSKYIDGLEVSEGSDEESKSMRFGSDDMSF